MPLVLLGAACGGGGGSAPTTANLAGQLRLPEVAPARLAPSFDAERPMLVGEVVIWLEPGALAADLAVDGTELVRAPGGPIVVLRTPAAAGKPRVGDGWPLEQTAEHATCLAAQDLAQKPGVLCVSPNYLLQPCIQPNDTYYDKQWHYPQINLPQAWDVTTGSANVIVAVLDTGIVSAHPDFTGRIIGGFDMISNAAAARDGDGRDANPEDVGDLATPQGSSFHGTHVAGTIGANGNDGIGVAGVDWNCKLMPVRCLGQGGGSVDDIANAILFAARLPNGSGQLPPQRADIVNMSLGGPGFNAVLSQACNEAANAGVLLVAAAGNDNTNQGGSPAQFDSVLSVGATDLVRARAPYSNFSSTVDIWAPGGDMGADRNSDTFPDGVLSCAANDQGQLFWKFENGTSMASPHVAGVAALVKAANSALTASQIRTILINTAVPVPGLPNAGRLIDALAAVQSASGGAPSAPILVASPSAIDFAASGTTATVNIENRGNGTLTLLSVGGITVSPPAPWLTPVQMNVNASNIDFDRFDLTVNRAGLANGVYQTRLTLSYTDGTMPVSVGIDLRLQVGASTIANDTVFVLLVDPFTLATVVQAETTAGRGFAFNMGAVPPGGYILVAGTDRDNDDLLGDAGELFGAWPSLDTLLELSVAAGDNASGLDFGLQELATVTSARAGVPFTPRRLR
ncbi:MAG: S8 family serine peptidase [Planctomycetota bacterium]